LIFLQFPLPAAKEFLHFSPWLVGHLLSSCTASFWIDQRHEEHLHVVTGTRIGGHSEGRRHNGEEEADNVRGGGHGTVDLMGNSKAAMV
jgi:hypothetical protein